MAGYVKRDSIKALRYEDYVPHVFSLMDSVRLSAEEAISLMKATESYVHDIRHTTLNRSYTEISDVYLTDFVLSIEGISDGDMAVNFELDKVLTTQYGKPIISMVVFQERGSTMIYGLRPIDSSGMGRKFWVIDGSATDPITEAACCGLSIFASIQKCIQNPDLFEVEEKRVKRVSKGKKGKPNKGGQKVQIIKQYRLVRDTPLMGKKGKHKINCPSWSVRGHYRHYKSGKVVFIESYRKGKKRDQFSPKEYGISVPSKSTKEVPE